MRSIRKLLIPANPFLSKQIGISTAETRRSVLIVDIHHQMILGSQANQVVQPRSPTMAGILHKAGLHTHNAPFPKYREEFTRLLHQGMLVDVHPNANSLFFSVSYHTRHVQFVYYFGSVSVVRSTRQIPQPVEKHIRNVMFGTEVDCGNSPFGADGCLTHDSTRSHPFGGIGYLARRIQILDYIVMFQQLSRFLRSHYHFPRGGIIGHHIYRTVHYGSQRILFLRRSLILGKTPVVHIGIQQCSPQTAGQFQRQGALYGTFQFVDIQMLKESLRPLFRPGFRTGRQGIFRQIPHYLMEGGTRVFGEEIAESNTFIVSTHLYVKTIERAVFLGKMKCCRIITVAYFAAFTVKRFPCIIHCRCISH